MLQTSTIREMPTDLPATYGFRITGRVTRDDMAAMGDRMLDAFDTHDTVDMLLVFDTEETAHTGASASLDAMKAQAKSLSRVRNYVVASPPGRAGDILEAMDKVMPVKAVTFDTEHEALEWLRAQPTLAGQTR